MYIFRSSTSGSFAPYRTKLMRNGLTDPILGRCGRATALGFGVLGFAVLAFAVLGLLALPALAAGDNVVMIAVAHVQVPPNLPGLCQVDGFVRHVWEGKAFHEGQAITLKVPCGDRHGGFLPPATATQGPRLTDPSVLSASALGAAHIDDDANLMWQPENSSRDVIWGYRVLQAVRLRLAGSV
jgi:hypothetical protein